MSWRGCGLAPRVPECGAGEGRRQDQDALTLSSASSRRGARCYASVARSAEGSVGRGEWQQEVEVRRGGKVVVDRFEVSFGSDFCGPTRAVSWASCNALGCRIWGWYSLPEARPISNLGRPSSSGCPPQLFLGVFARVRLATPLITAPEMDSPRSWERLASGDGRAEQGVELFTRRKLS